MKSAWVRARKNLAGGVNSPVRAFKAVGGIPVFMERGLGPYLYDGSGKRYVDHCLSWGAILFGHADAQTAAAVRRQAVKGTSFGTVTELETSLAVEIKKAFPGMERIRFTSSGTEAVMSAIRLARGITGKDRIVKFEGCYHGHSDSLLVRSGSGLATFGVPDSAGVPKELAALTVTLPYNDVAAAQNLFKEQSDIACVIVEPVAANMGVVPPRNDFLRALRRQTSRHGALLIFDEVVSGFRICYGGAQHFYGVQPDITVLGKIIGGGLPIGAFGARLSLMRRLAPEGPVYQAGTLSGNPLSMASGISVLSRLSKSFYDGLNRRSAAFVAEARAVLKKRHRQVVVQNVGSMFTVFFGSAGVRNFSDARRADSNAFRRFFHRMLAQGIYMPPSAFEACFISETHGAAEFTKTLKGMARC